MDDSRHSLVVTLPPSGALTLADHHAQHPTHSSAEPHYGRLVLMVAASFLIMFFLMYAMVNALANVFINVNQFYMAGLMAAPMALGELFIMRHMYRDRRKNVMVIAGSVILSIGFWVGIRQQVAVTNTQFLRSMIPHHASAILMCQQAPITDAAIKTLCRGIVSSQQSEIDQMKALLGR